MDPTAKDRRKEPRDDQKGSSRKKKNALVIFHDGKEFWTTQNQFWQLVRDKVVVKSGDNPLCGKFVLADKEKAATSKNII